MYIYTYEAIGPDESEKIHIYTRGSSTQAAPTHDWKRKGLHLLPGAWSALYREYRVLKDNTNWTQIILHLPLSSLISDAKPHIK